MRFKLQLLMLLCSILPGFAATGVQGTLVDAVTGAPVVDANVLLRDGAQFVTTAPTVTSAYRTPLRDTTSCRLWHSVSMTSSWMST